MVVEAPAFEDLALKGPAAVPIVPHLFHNSSNSGIHCSHPRLLAKPVVANDL